MRARHTYRIRIEVDHVSREQAIEVFEDIIFKLKAKNWATENVSKFADPPDPTTRIEMGPIMLSMEERVARLEREFDYRLGGISEDAA